MTTIWVCASWLVLIVISVSQLASASLIQFTELSSLSQNLVKIINLFNLSDLKAMKNNQKSGLNTRIKMGWCQLAGAIAISVSQLASASLIQCTEFSSLSQNWVKMTTGNLFNLSDLKVMKNNQKSRLNTRTLYR